MFGYTTLWFIINYNIYFRLTPFFDIHISQGSVATHLRRGGIFEHDFVANFLRSTPIKKFKNRLIFRVVMSKSLVSCFLTHSVYTVQPTLHVVSQSVTAARRHCIHVSICTDLKIHPLLGCNFLQIDFFYPNPISIIFGRNIGNTVHYAYATLTLFADNPTNRLYLA